MKTFSSRVKDLTNKRVGKLIVASFSHIDKRHSAYWKCQCDCGNECIVRSGFLMREETKSCGCLPKICGIENPAYKGYEGISASIYGQIKRSSVRGRTLEFKVSIKYLWDLFIKQDKKCALTGIDIKFPSRSNIHDGTASLDRIDSSKGYIEGNVQWVHRDINIMKHNFDQNYFVEMCKKVVGYS